MAPVCSSSVGGAQLAAAVWDAPGSAELELEPVWELELEPVWGLVRVPV